MDKPASVNKCMYCGTTERPLTDEHIIPYDRNRSRSSEQPYVYEGPRRFGLFGHERGAFAVAVDPGNPECSIIAAGLAGAWPLRRSSSIDPTSR